MSGFLILGYYYEYIKKDARKIIFDYILGCTCAVLSAVEIAAYVCFLEMFFTNGYFK